MPELPLDTAMVIAQLPFAGMLAPVRVTTPLVADTDPAQLVAAAGDVAMVRFDGNVSVSAACVSA